ncbi:hypothetical protein CC80DRAFT_493739 [Byssothecium circinans]|uniref:PPP4R2-domain-containing protein n=1 Tax=Byssothecium circinans TaxID=147558 RepID=A0A6A5TSC0_9PLEO|nr:hypothetical protein CC80DRAFT_493739 [Byssothecium circinans]
MTSAETILQRAAEDGSLDPAEWTKTLQYILDRLDEIINDFPKPPQSANPSSSANTPARPQPTPSSQESAGGDKENAAPTTPTRPPVPSFSTAEASPIPQDIVTFYSSIRNQLSTNFAKDAPHTIQRLAELILEPKRRYRFLPPYLRALDRIVSVSSSNSLFPLPQAVLSPTPTLLNGTTSIPSPSSTLGSDESLGGALLTPIPWLQSRGAQNELISESTEIVDGPNGAGRIETVTVGMLNGNGNGTTPDQTSPPSSSTPSISQIASSHPAGETLPSTGAVTQGEILRQEQEAGIVLNNPHSLTSNHARTSAPSDIDNTNPTAVINTVEPEDEAPHARGPETIGMEDTGPQKSAGSLDIEGAVGRPSIERSSKSPGPSPGSAVPEPKDEEMKDAGSEDNKMEKENKKQQKEEEKADEEMKADE